jgi:hypothetical protein
MLLHHSCSKRSIISFIPTSNLKRGIVLVKGPASIRGMVYGVCSYLLPAALIETDYGFSGVENVLDRRDCFLFSALGSVLIFALEARGVCFLPWLRP